MSYDFLLNNLLFPPRASQPDPPTQATEPTNRTHIPTAPTSATGPIPIPTNPIKTPPQTQPSSPLNTITPDTSLHSDHQSASPTASAQQQPHQSHTSPPNSTQQLQPTLEQQPITEPIFVHQHLTPIPSNTHPMVTRAKDGIFEYVDHLLLHTTTTSPIPCSHIHAHRDPFWEKAIVISSLHGEFAMNDRGSLNYFLGVSAQCFATRVFLSQAIYAEELLERDHMQNYILVRLLLILILSLVSRVCLYKNDPQEPHFYVLKRILGYVRGTLDYGLQLHVSNTARLTAYMDADWVGFLVTRRSTSGYCVFLGDNNIVAETAWIRNLLCEFDRPKTSRSNCEAVLAEWTMRPKCSGGKMGGSGGFVQRVKKATG
nr:hypothetical protein [Tanacetum cinerariifolium]